MKSVLVESLSKNYDTVQAVRSIDFAVEQGCFFAFLGPNGAGKSTTISILCTMLQKSGGRALVAGHEIGREDIQIREKIGVVFQNNVLDKLLTVEENIVLRASLYGVSQSELAARLSEVTRALDIGDLLKRRYAKLSGGQKRRVEIARALLHRPEILILDEPTTGLDPQTRRSVWQAVFRMQRETGLTVFLTTHYMEEAARADEVAIIDDGLIVAQGTPQNLKERYSSDRLLLTPRADSALAEKLTQRKIPFVSEGGTLAVTVTDSREALRLLNELEGQYSSFEKRSGDMDDVFMNITGHAIREGAAE